MDGYGDEYGDMMGGMGGMDGMDGMDGMGGLGMDGYGDMAEL